MKLKLFVLFVAAILVIPGFWTTASATTLAENTFDLDTNGCGKFVATTGSPPANIPSFEEAANAGVAARSEAPSENNSLTLLLTGLLLVAGGVWRRRAASDT